MLKKWIGILKERFKVYNLTMVSIQTSQTSEKSFFINISSKIYFSLTFKILDHRVHKKIEQLSKIWFHSGFHFFNKYKNKNLDLCKMYDKNGVHPEERFEELQFHQQCRFPIGKFEKI